jgi:hypothetical protein
MREIEKVLRQARDQGKLQYDFDIREVARRIGAMKYELSNKVIEEYIESGKELTFGCFAAWLFKKKGENVW